jgi:hypothetical protein
MARTRTQNYGHLRIFPMNSSNAKRDAQRPPFDVANLANLANLIHNTLVGKALRALPRAHRYVANMAKLPSLFLNPWQFSYEAD